MSISTNRARTKINFKRDNLMIFLYEQYTFIIVLSLLIVGVSYVLVFRGFNRWIQTHWFYEVRITHKVAAFFWFGGITCLALALMDLRGPEKIIQGKISNQKTMILIDTSASMFVEDVRPNRFEKSIFLAKHFVKKAVGQKLSVAVFSDAQKTIVPFTDDLDLIEARIEGLKELNLRNGGTGLSIAIQEAVQKFKAVEGDEAGNILIFTDAEETDGGIELTVPDGVSVGVVGIGTRKGGVIPVRNSRKEFIQNKRYQGEVVISKLDESFIKRFGKSIKYFKYWIATSYSLPTEQILNFFSKSHSSKISQNNFRTRPVEARWLLIPGMILLGLSYLIKLTKPFKVLMLLLFVVPRGWAQLPMNHPIEQTKESKDPVKSKETKKLEDLFSRNELDENGKKFLALKLHQDRFYNQADTLYEEVLGETITENNIVQQFNRAASEIKNKKLEKAINRYRDILDFLEKNPSLSDNDLASKTKLNMLRALAANGGKGKGESEDSEKQKQKSKEQSGEGKSEKKEKDEKKGKKQNQKNKKPDQDQKRNDGDDKAESEQEKKKRKAKLPSLLKQLMSDDNNLQKKMIDTDTTKRKTTQQRDW